ncbi:hypothetical protein, partial [Paenibacillus sp. P46E]|uniref:hypothetical protein n=1 Tax=Paenibacillus sp. P46E TaxID=1349436 RepID=UPI000AF1B074
ETLEDYLDLEDDLQVFNEEKWRENFNKIKESIVEENIEILRIEENIGSGEGINYIIEGIDNNIDSSLRKNFEDNNFISGEIEIYREEKIG